MLMTTKMWRRPKKVKKASGYARRAAVNKAAVNNASNLAPEATHLTKKSPEQSAVVAGGGKEQDGGSRSVGEVGGMGGMRRLAWERGGAGCEGVEGLDTNAHTRLALLSPLQTYAENGITKQGPVCIKLESLSMLFERKAMMLSDANGLQASSLSLILLHICPHTYVHGLILLYLCPHSRQAPARTCPQALHKQRIET
jgi:hypothetical protein